MGISASPLSIEHSSDDRPVGHDEVSNTHKSKSKRDYEVPCTLTHHHSYYTKTMGEEGEWD